MSVVIFRARRLALRRTESVFPSRGSCWRGRCRVQPRALCSSRWKTTVRTRTVWPSVFEQNRKAILGATLVGCRGRVQSANGVIHLIVEQIVDRSAKLKRISGLDAAFPMVSGRYDEAKTGEAGRIAARLDRPNLSRATCAYRISTSIQ
jgi:hypothetical protein